MLFRSTACVDPADPAAPLDLKEAIYSQRDATFRGAEFQSQLDVGPLYGGIWGVEDQFDVVRATFTDGTNVPRIPRRILSYLLSPFVWHRAPNGNSGGRPRPSGRRPVLEIHLRWRFTKPRIWKTDRRIRVWMSIGVQI